MYIGIAKSLLAAARRKMAASHMFPVQSRVATRWSKAAAAKVSPWYSQNILDGATAFGIEQLRSLGFSIAGFRAVPMKCSVLTDQADAS